MWLLGVSAFALSTGMAYSLWWADVVRHYRFTWWVTPGDFWATWRDAQYIAWGSPSFVYSDHANLVTLPGYAAILAPAAWIAWHLGLSQSATFIAIPRPQAWLIGGPFALGSIGVGLWAFDSVARALEMGVGRRRVLTVMEATAMWVTVAIWGHPEDVLAVACCAFCFSSLQKQHWTKAAWLLGAALSFQLYAILVVPVLLAVAGHRRMVPFALRASVLPGFLLVAVLVPDFHAAWKALTEQPNFPAIDHPSPWVLLSPSIGKNVVAAGPARVIGLLLAIGCGFVAHCYRARADVVLWLMAAALAGRCVFEAVMVPYYVMPAIAVAIVLGVRRGTPAFAATFVASGALTVVTFYHANMWIYWGEMTSLFIVLLVATCPLLRRRRHHDRSERVAPATASVPVEADPFPPLTTAH